MLTRSKQAPNFPAKPPEPPWLQAAMIGISLSTMAAGAIALGSGLAISQAIIKGK